MLSMVRRSTCRMVTPRTSLGDLRRGVGGVGKGTVGDGRGTVIRGPWEVRRTRGSSFPLPLKYGEGSGPSCPPRQDPSVPGPQEETPGDFQCDTGPSVRRGRRDEPPDIGSGNTVPDSLNATIVAGDRYRKENGGEVPLRPTPFRSLSSPFPGKSQGKSSFNPPVQTSRFFCGRGPDGKWSCFTHVPTVLEERSQVLPDKGTTGTVSFKVR